MAKTASSGRARLALLVSMAAAASLALAFQREWVSIPPEWSPWVALDLDSSPNFHTRYKLSRLSGNRELCEQVLAGADMTYRWVDD